MSDSVIRLLDRRLTADGPLSRRFHAAGVCIGALGGGAYATPAG